MEDSILLLKCLVENLKEGIHIVDGKGKTIYYNQAMGTIEGVEANEVMGKEIQEYLKGLEEKSTIIQGLKSGLASRDNIQNYSNDKGKIITSINSTIPVLKDGRVEAVIEIARDMTQIKKLNETICNLGSKGKSEKHYYTFKDIIGGSKAMQEEILKSRRAGLSNSSVLIYGETGCGKELFAQSIHYEGVRSDKPFIAINCAAIPSALLEGILFGTVKGSFTGAENKKGLFEEAHRGTILLDEVNSMDPYLQSKLLRVLQDGYIRPIGSNKYIDVDVRIIATINEEPKKLMEEGKLRKDFYYRLSVIRLTIPPLRERREDIRPLCKHFMDYYNKILFKNVESISEDVLEGFMTYDWPGNVRELKNSIEGAMNMIEDGHILTKESFGNKINMIIEQESQRSYKEPIGLDEHMNKVEKEIITRVYLSNKKNVSKTAQELMISRQNLQYKLKKHRIMEH